MALSLGSHSQLRVLEQAGKPVAAFRSFWKRIVRLCLQILPHRMTYHFLRPQGTRRKVQTYCQHELGRCVWKGQDPFDSSDQRGEFETSIQPTSPISSVHYYVSTSKISRHWWITPIPTDNQHYVPKITCLIHECIHLFYKSKEQNTTHMKNVFQNWTKDDSIPITRFNYNSQRFTF